MEETVKTRRKPGPVPNPARRRTTVMLEDELAEWGKRQPGGLSELLRRLLMEERERQRRERGRRSLDGED